MHVQPINKQTNISSKALYFPKKPSNTYVTDKAIRNAIKNNPFIGKLSEMSDIFVRYWNAKNVYYSMNIDIVDLQKKKTKVSMSYVSNYLRNMHNFSETDFISHIKEPNADKKGNLLTKIMRCSRMHHENNEYYHMGFVGPHLVRRMLYNKKDAEAIGMENIIKCAIDCQKNLQEMNKETMNEIIAKSENKII